MPRRDSSVATRLQCPYAVDRAGYTGAKQLGGYQHSASRYDAVTSERVASGTVEAHAKKRLAYLQGAM
eukprot:5453577-Pyramimonas_sp.AAC.1